MITLKTVLRVYPKGIKANKRPTFSFAALNLEDINKHRKLSMVLETPPTPQISDFILIV